MAGFLNVRFRSRIPQCGFPVGLVVYVRLVCSILTGGWRGSDLPALFRLPLKQIEWIDSSVLAHSARRRCDPVRRDRDRVGTNSRIQVNRCFDLSVRGDQSDDIVIVDAKLFGSFGFISIQVFHITVVVGSGVSWSQGMLAPLSPRMGG